MAASHICIAVLTACVLLMLLKNLVQTLSASTYILDQLHRSVRILDRASRVLSAGTRLVGSKSGDIMTSLGLVHWSRVTVVPRPTRRRISHNPKCQLLVSAVH